MKGFKDFESKSNTSRPSAAGRDNASQLSTARKQSMSLVDTAFVQPEVLRYRYEKKSKTDEDTNFSFQNLYRTPEQYIDALSQRIPLNDLYVVKDCFCDNAANQYCAVTLEVKDPHLLRTLNIKPEDRILKVYNKEGEIVYQRVVVPIDDKHLKSATNSKYFRKDKD